MAFTKVSASWAIHISKGHSIDASCFPLIIIASQVQWLQRESNNTIDNKQWFIKSLAYYHSYNFMFRKSTSHLTFWSHDDLGFDIRALIYAINFVLKLYSSSGIYLHLLNSTRVYMCYWPCDELLIAVIESETCLLSFTWWPILNITFY